MGFHQSRSLRRACYLAASLALLNGAGGIASAQPYVDLPLTPHPSPGLDWVAVTDDLIAGTFPNVTASWQYYPETPQMPRHGDVSLLIGGNRSFFQVQTVAPAEKSLRIGVIEAWRRDPRTGPGPLVAPQLNYQGGLSVQTSHAGIVLATRVALSGKPDIMLPDMFHPGMIAWPMEDLLLADVERHGPPNKMSTWDRLAKLYRPLIPRLKRMSPAQREDAVSRLVLGLPEITRAGQDLMRIYGVPESTVVQVRMEGRLYQGLVGMNVTSMELHLRFKSKDPLNLISVLADFPAELRKPATFGRLRR